MNLDLVVLDWSGTISNDFPMVLAGINSVLEHFDKEPVSAHQLREEAALDVFLFYHRRNIYDYKKIKEMLASFYREAEKKPEPVPGAVEVVKELSSFACVAVFSSHPQDEVNNDISRYGLGDCLNFAIGSAKKDTCTDFRALLTNAGASAHNVVYVGDMLCDVELADKAGAPSIAVVNPGYGYQLRHQLEAHPVQPTLGIIEKINDLPEKIKNGF